MVDTTLMQTLWGQYTQEFSAKIKLQGVPQLLYPPTPWNWGGKNPPMGSLPYQQINYLNEVPIGALSDANDYGMKPGFASQYKLMLGQIATTNLGQRGRQLSQAVTDASQALGRVATQVSVAYTNYKNQTGSSMSYQDWLQGPGMANQAQLDQAKGTLTSAQEAQTQYINSLKGPITDATNKYDNNLITAVGQGGTTLSDQPGWQTAETPYAYVNRITEDNFGGDSVAGNALSFAISQDTERYSNSVVYGGGDIFGVIDFFGIEAEGAYKKVSTSSFQDQYNINFSFEDVTPVNVTAGGWYNPAIPDNYKNGPWQPNHSGFESGSDTYYYGEGGDLSRIISQIIIGYRFTITIEAGSNFATHVKQETEGGGGLIIGPFVFGATGGSESTKDTIDISGGVITAKNNGDWGYIIGMATNWVVNP